MKTENLALALLTAFAAGCAEPDDPLLGTSSMGTEMPDAPDVPDMPEPPDSPDPPDEPDPPEPPDDPDPPDPPAPDPDPDPEPPHAFDGLHAWTMTRLGDPLVSTCGFYGPLVDVAWTLGNPGVAWIMFTELSNGDDHYQLVCDREGDEVICESFGIDFFGSWMETYMELEPNPDGSASMVGTQIGEIALNGGETCSFVFDVIFEPAQATVLEPLGCAAESVLSASFINETSTVWIYGDNAQPVDVFRLDSDGQRQWLFTLPPASGTSLAVPVGTPLVLADPNGACRDVFIADGELATTDGSIG